MLPLSGIRVLDLSRIFAAPWATQMLGDLGAEVIKVEHPSKGDDFRTYGPPFLPDEDGGNSRESGYYLSANRNKKAVSADLATREGQEFVRRIAKTADVLVENFKVGGLVKYGLDYASVAAINPGIVYCSITGFGQDGPYAPRGGLDSLIQALSGLMSLTGEADGQPQKVGTIIDDFATGMYAAVSILAALRHREVNGGKGQRIDLSLLDCGIALLGPRIQAFLISGEEPQRTGNASFGSAPAQTFACADGIIMIQAGSDRQFALLCRAIGLESLVDDPRYATRAQRTQNLASLIPAISARLEEESLATWIDRLQAAGVMCSPVNKVSDALADAQVRHRALVETIEHPLEPELKIIRNPIRFSETPIRRYTAPPMIGEHTDEVRQMLDGELGQTGTERETPPGTAST